jgi:hypothetical protein
VEDEVKGYLTEFNTLRGQIRDAIKGLNDEAANWCPPPKDTNSIYALITHLTGAQANWMKRVIAGISVTRHREAEFKASGNLSEIVKQWEAVDKETDEILGRLSQTQLRDTRDVGGAFGRVTVQWCILHQISHYATHLGHMQLTRQMWEFSLQHGREPLS